jgi:hypothetical protein
MRIMSKHREQGIALVIVMLTMSLLAALVGAVTLAAVTETVVAANYREAVDALYTAEAGVEYVLQEIAPVDDWTDLLAEPGQSGFVDGPPAGVRQVGTATLDLARATADVAAAAAAPAGAVRLPSVLYAFGWFKDLVPGAGQRSQTYVAIWLADRSPGPKDDSVPPVALSVVAEAFGARGARRAVETIVEKRDRGVRMLAWRELP